MTTTTVEFYWRANDGTWVSYDMGIYPVAGDQITADDTATTESLTNWLAEWLDGAEGEWYATAGDIESDVIDNNRAV